MRNIITQCTSSHRMNILDLPLKLAFGRVCICMQYVSSVCHLIAIIAQLYCSHRKTSDGRSGMVFLSMVSGVQATDMNRGGDCSCAARARVQDRQRCAAHARRVPADSACRVPVPPALAQPARALPAAALPRRAAHPARHAGHAADSPGVQRGDHRAGGTGFLLLTLPTHDHRLPTTALQWLFSFYRCHCIEQHSVCTAPIWQAATVHAEVSGCPST